MTLEFKAFNNEIDSLVAFMTSTIWHYHSSSHVQASRIIKAYENGYYTDEGIETFWVLQQGQKIGLIRLYDLDDGTPLFDIRFLDAYRGCGLGLTAVMWLIDYVFNHYKAIDRIEANTRQDNYAMRKVCLKCGFVKESHYRKAWVSREGTVHDAIGYGILREDWSNKTTTPVDWMDFEVEQ